MSGVEITSTVLMVLGAIVLVTGAAGVLRFPDFYTRLHAAGKGDTLGQTLILVGLGLPVGVGIISLKLALIILFIFVLNPTATHALARGAWIVGLAPWTRKPAPSEAEADEHGEEG